MNVKNLGPVLKSEKADICIIAGLGAMWGAVYSASRGGRKAQDILDAERKKTLKKNEDGTITWIEPSFKEKFKLTWKCYIGTAVVGAAGTAAIVYGTAENRKKIAGLAAACTIAEKALSDHKEELKELVGEEKAAEIEKKVAEKQAAKVEPPTDIRPDVTGLAEPKTLIWDEYLGRYFYAYPNEVKEMCDWVNHELAMCTSFVSINEAFEHLNKISTSSDEIKPVGAGQGVGWSLAQYRDCNEYISFKLSGSDDLTPRGQAFAILHYTRPEPYSRDRVMW